MRILIAEDGGIITRKKLKSIISSVEISTVRGAWYSLEVGEC